LALRDVVAQPRVWFRMGDLGFLTADGKPQHVSGPAVELIGSQTVPACPVHDVAHQKVRFEACYSRCMLLLPFCRHAATTQAQLLFLYTNCIHSNIHQDHTIDLQSSNSDATASLQVCCT
jgi:hypothetical protein